MPVGAQPSKIALDGALNQIASQLDSVMLAITHLQRGIGTWTDAQVAALGYDLTTEVQTGTGIIRPVASDMVQFKNIYNGAASLAVAEDFGTSFAKVLWI